MTRPLLRFSVVLVLLLAACGGGGEERADEEPCPSPEPGAPTPTPTPSPCVVVATEGETEAGGTTGGGGYVFSLTQPIPEAGGVQTQTADLDIKLTVDDGNVSGTVEGPTTQELTQPTCPSGTVADGKTTAEVVGTLTDEALELQVVNASWDRPTVEPCPEGGLPGLIGEGIPSGIYGFEESLSRLERADDGAYRYDHMETVDVGGYPFTVEYHVVVRFRE